MSHGIILADYFQKIRRRMDRREFLKKIGNRDLNHQAAKSAKFSETNDPRPSSFLASCRFKFF